jgi:hypothetical protein
MIKIQQASFGLASIFVAAVLVGFDSQIASACSGVGSTSSGLSHGSKIGSGSVTVCVGSSSSSAGSTTTRTITKIVKVPVPAKTKPAPKPASKPAAKPAKAPIRKTTVTPVSCPSATQRASMPRSADAAQRWVQSICSPAPKKTVAAKKPKPKPPSKTKTITITETIVVSTPSRKTFSSDAVELSPNALVASVFPAKTLEIGELAKFSSNPSSHFSSAIVLGRQAQVHFVPKASSWKFSDGASLTGADTQRTFMSAGRFQIRAYVEYVVSYRILGESAWKPVAGTILVESNLLELEVGTLNPIQDPSPQGVLLVGEDCIGRMGVFGCDT